MKFIKENWIADIFVKIVILIVLVVAIIVYLPISDDSSRFTGSADSFTFTMEKSNTLFKAKEIGFFADTIDFHPTKNISIHYDNDTIIEKDDLLSIYVNYSGKRQQIIKNAEVRIFSDSTQIHKDDILNKFTYYGVLNAVNGNTVDLALNEYTIRIYIDSVDSVMIGSETITDFIYIDFEMVDNPYSNVYFDTDDIALNIYDVSEFSSSGQLSRIRLRRGEGILGIGDHEFDIKNNDILDVEIAYVDFSRLSANDRIMEFDGFVKSAKLNYKNIFINDPIYMLKFKPEQINAYATLVNAGATLVLVIITIVYVFFTQQMAKQAEENNKHTESVIEESKKERRMSFIEKRLENFYYPLHDFLLLSVTDNRRKDPTTDTPQLTIPKYFDKKDNRVNDINYKDVINHQYLAEKNVGKELDYFLKTIFTEKRTQNKDEIDRYDKLVKLVEDDIKHIRKEYEELFSN